MASYVGSTLTSVRNRLYQAYESFKNAEYQKFADEKIKPVAIAALKLVATAFFISQSSHFLAFSFVAGLAFPEIGAKLGLISDAFTTKASILEKTYCVAITFFGSVVSLNAAALVFGAYLGASISSKQVQKA